MTEHQTSRTLVKSAPELWAECSDAASLARHLGAFGEIRITKLEAETTVAWEGAAASGTVKLESSGWGTRVTLTVTQGERPAEPEPVALEPEPVAVEPVAVEPEPVAVEPEPAGISAEPARPLGRLARFRLAFRRRAAPAVQSIVPDSEPEPEPVAETPAAPAPAPGTAPAPEPAPATGEDALVAALDSLGMAHHRPYSRG
jgi:hypothetical protein